MREYNNVACKSFQGFFTHSLNERSGAVILILLDMSMLRI